VRGRCNFPANKNSRKKKSRNRKRGSKQTNNGGGIETAVRRIIYPPRVATSERVEVKFLDSELGPVAVTSAGQLTKLSTVAQGATSSQRVGDEIQTEALSLKVNWTAVAGGGIVRTIVLQWNLSDSIVAPSLLGILKTPAAAANYPLAHYNIQNVEQEVFSVLSDKLSFVNTAGGPQTFQESIVVKPKGSCRYDAAALTGQGMFYVLFVSDNLAAQCVVSMTARLLYTDS
jgi:hypothetical protein